MPIQTNHRLSTSGKLMVGWIAAVVLLLFTGTLLVSLGAEARDALEHGNPGTFTAEHSERNGRSKRHWVGTFVSDDGTITESDVVLTQTERVGRDDDPPVVDAVLGGSDEHPRAYDTAYDTDGRMVKGIVALALGALIGLGGVIVVLVRALRQTSRRQLSSS